MTPLQILVVEDHPVVSHPLCRYLRQLGHAVILATALRDAKAELAHQRFQLVLAEIDMPDGDATELVEAIPGDCAMVTVSGYDFSLPPHRRAGWLGHLTKPYATDDLLALIGRASEAKTPAATEFRAVA